MKIIFFGSDDFALQHLIALHESEYDVVLCVTQPDRPRNRGQRMTISPIKEYALDQNIEVFQPTDFKSTEVEEYLRKFDSDLFVVIAYGRILPVRILQIPALYAINVHGSVLPKLRGAAPINWAVINGDQNTGLTIIRMNARMDAGEILNVYEFPIGPNDTSETIRNKMMSEGGAFLLETVKQIQNKSVVLTTQDESQVTYASKLNKAMGLIDWKLSAQEIHNLVRGLQPWPGAYTQFKGKILKVFETQVVDGGRLASDVPGKILDVTSGGLVIGAGSGRLLVGFVQQEGAKRMCAADFVRGARIEPGFCF